MAVAMNATPRIASTTLFQVPIGQHDLDTFKIPETQPSYGAINCTIVTAQLLKIITPGFAEQATREQLTNLAAGLPIPEIRYTSTHQWLELFNSFPPLPDFTKITYRLELLPITIDSLNIVYQNIFPGFATWIMGYRQTGSGHSFVAAKDNTNLYWLFDPQMGEVYKGPEAIIQYFLQQSIDHSFHTIHKNLFRTPEQHAYDFEYSVRNSELYKRAEKSCPILKFKKGPKAKAVNTMKLAARTRWNKNFESRIKEVRRRQIQAYRNRGINNTRRNNNSSNKNRMRNNNNSSNKNRMRNNNNSSNKNRMTLDGGSGSFVLYNSVPINGQALSKKQTQTKPTVTIPPNHTLVMYDPDAVKPSYIHWLVNSNQEYIPYQGPSPPPGTGIHHYKFVLFSGTPLTIPSKRNSVNIQKIFDTPVANAFFTVEA